MRRKQENKFTGFIAKNSSDIISLVDFLELI